MEKQIVVNDECRQFLMKAFGCSRVTVWKSLTFKSDSDKSRKIRHLALQRGGELVGVPEAETTYEEVEGTMTQRFGRRVKLVYTRATNMYAGYVDDAMDRTGAAGDIVSFMKIQQEVELLAASL